MSDSSFVLIARAETESTSLTGETKSEWGPWQKVTAPVGYAINKDKIKVEALVERGSKNTDERVFSDWVEIIPGTGVEQPRTFEVRAFARSSKGHGSGGGATEYKYTGNYFKY